MNAKNRFSSLTVTTGAYGEVILKVLLSTVRHDPRINTKYHETETFFV